MMDKELHIVAFNVPWPANYGGVIDVFYRLRALSRAGVRIHLHCYTYGRPAARELEQYCVEVCYYKRDMSFLRQLDRRPFIVSSRCNKELLERLLQDDLPILLEGLHCCSLLEEPRLQGRLMMVRAHNVEADYYSRLARSERNPLRKAYLALDAAKLRRYEPILRRASAVFAISQADQEAFLQMGCRNVPLVTAAHPYEATQQPLSALHSPLSTLHSPLSTLTSPYALFHGQLSVAENVKAAEWLMDHVFAGSSHRLVVAGLNPTRALRHKIAQHPNVTLVASPDDDTMQRLVAEAQVNILFTDQPTGMKLKLLHALFCGRHCLVNSAMVAGTDLESLCQVADSAEAMCAALDKLMQTPFSQQMAAERAEKIRPYTADSSIRPILEIL